MKQVCKIFLVCKMMLWRTGSQMEYYAQIQRVHFHLASNFLIIFGVDIFKIC